MRFNVTAMSSTLCVICAAPYNQVQTLETLSLKIPCHCCYSFMSLFAQWCERTFLPSRVVHHFRPNIYQESSILVSQIPVFFSKMRLSIQFLTFKRWKWKSFGRAPSYDVLYAKLVTSLKDQSMFYLVNAVADLARTTGRGGGII